MPERICSVDGCCAAHRARGLCSTHYNQQRQPERHRKSTVVCGQCGKPTLKHVSSRYTERFCSLSCRDVWRKATGNNPAPSTPFAGWSRRRLALAKLARAMRGPGPRYWVAGWCQRCGSPFVSQLRDDGGRYCSNTCKRRQRASRRRARERGALHVPYSRLTIFERDRWRCHICRRMTDATKVVPHPKAPTIDHLVPLVEGGDDTAANVACACFLCNSTRSDRGGGEQLALM